MEKVGGWFKRLTSKEARTAYKQVQDIKAKFLDALAERGYQYKNGKVTAAVPDEKEKTAEAVDEGGEKTRFSRLAETAIDLSDNTELSKLIGENKGAAKYKIIQQYVLDSLSGEITLSDGIKATVDKRDAQHIAAFHSVGKGLAEVAKIREIVETAEPYAYEKSTDNEKFLSFRYYRAFVKYSDEIFPVYVNVGLTSNNSGYKIYDITQRIRDTAHLLKGVERLPDGSIALGNGILNNRVSQPSENVNPKSEKSDVRFSRVTPEQDRAYMQAVENGDIRFSRAGVDSYTQKQYNDYGWARANEILTASENSELRSKFADIKKNNHYYPQTKSGDYMIAIGKDGQKIAFMRGTITNPVISSVIEIDAVGIELDEERRNIYEGERRGIQQTVGDLFRRYSSSDYKDSWTGKSSESVGNSGGVKLQRGTSSAEAQRVGQNGNKRAISYHFNDDGSQKITYADGTEEIRFSRAADERSISTKKDVADLLDTIIETELVYDDGKYEEWRGVVKGKGKIVDQLMEGLKTAKNKQALAEQIADLLIDQTVMEEVYSFNKPDDAAVERAERPLGKRNAEWNEKTCAEGLTRRKECAIISKRSENGGLFQAKIRRKTDPHLGVAQLVARYLGVVEAARSSRVTQTKIGGSMNLRFLLYLCGSAPLLHPFFFSIFEGLSPLFFYAFSCFFYNFLGNKMALFQPKKFPTKEAMTL